MRRTVCQRALRMVDEVKSEHRAAQGRGCWSARQHALEARREEGSEEESA